ncbi:MAG: hypothetical protein IJU90_01460 [Bacteroidales bacterium]|nr:hypothetical protein [Bacteroidales bacterium]
MPKKTLIVIVVAIVATICHTSCNSTTPTDQATQPARGIYHWKATYNPTPWELRFLKDHHIQRLYIRMFDVDQNPEYNTDYPIIPIATTRFLQPLPDSMEIIPCVYITNNALKQDDKMSTLAARIYNRLSEISACNGFTFSEVQLDCDWTTSTRARYFDLCNNLKQQLSRKNITLSSTMRLYQLSDTSLSNIPVDRTTLMCYNLGGLQDALTNNSILEFTKAKPFFGLAKSLPENMDVAYPTFGWGVAFTRHNGEYIYSGLLHYPDINDTTFDHIREEHGEISQITQLQDHLASIYHAPHTTIIYHLDSANLSYYTHDEIEQIFSR